MIQMKNLILALSVVGLVIMTLNSCTKENETLSGQKPVSVAKTVKAPPTNNLRIWHDNGNVPGVEGVDYGCWDLGGNCLPTVVVVGTPIKVIKTLVHQIETNDIEGLNSTMKTNFDILSKIFETSVLQSIIDGKANISVRGSLTENSKAYFLISEKDEIEQVVPVAEQ
jgi:hypothetical protein